MFHNALLHEFYDVVSTRYPRDGEGMPYSQWIVENTKLRGKPYSFKGYEFQKAIADDFSQSMSVIKPSQVGLTEVQVRKNLAFLARNRGISSIYTLPNEKMFKRLSKTRVRPLVMSEKAFSGFSDDEKSIKSMDLYEINSSFAYFTGMGEGDATSIPADMLIHDELDLSDQTNIGLFQSRLQNSKFRITHRFSTPTLPGFAIDASYGASDQHEYMIKCQSCGHFQVPKFEMRFLKLSGYMGDGNLIQMTQDQYDSINLRDSAIICEKCHRALDLLNPDLREWVAMHPGRKTRGYRVRPFMNEALSLNYVLAQMMEMLRLDNTKAFYNTVLGEPFSDGSNQLTDEQIRRCLKGNAISEVGADIPVAVGIDVGRVCHVTLGVVKGDIVHPFAFYLVSANEIEDFVKDLCGKYNVVAGAMDRYPYTPTADNVFRISGEKIIPVDYKAGPFINIKRDEFGEFSYAQINRTATIDRVANLIRRQMMDISGYAQYEDIVRTHLKDMVRIETPEKEPSWEKVTGNDHFFHSLGYLQIAPKIFSVLHNLSQDLTASNRTMLGIFGIDLAIDRNQRDIYSTRSSPSRDLY